MQRPYKGIWLLLPAVLIALVIAPSVFGQETSAGLQGNVKDPTGAMIAKAKVEVASPALIGTKKAESDSAGYYRFANLPPGVYSLTVTSPGFRTFRQEGIDLQTGHLPSIDVRLEVGALTETVEVSSQAALIDSTQSKVQTNISSTSLMNLPTQSTSFQSVIQFAPGARAEPLQNNNDTSANAANNGFQINGASNSENSYLVDGQETASIFDGVSKSNLPMEFIDEVQVKTSGFEAEYGGALGGVVNVISKRGSNDWHGSVFMDYYADRFNAAPNASQRRNPAFPANNFAPRLDQPNQYYYPVKDHRRIIDPGFTLGGALIKDRLWIFAGTSPDFDQLRRTIVSSYPGAVGPRTFNDNTYTYYSQARLDFRATEKIRLYGSWNYQYARTTGSSLPNADDVHGLLNTSAGTNPDNFNGGIGVVYPQVLYNVGADVTITPSLIATTRFGYFYYDTQSRGLPTGNRYVYADTNYPYTAGNAPALAGTKALNGTPLPTQFLGSAGFSNIGGNSQTAFDRWKKFSFSQDLAYFKNFIGTHNLKFGYGFNHGLADEQSGTYNTSQTYVGYNVQYVPNTTNGASRCAAIVAQNIANYGADGAGGNADGSACQGLWGTVNLRDLISAAGKVGNWNHAFYVQDAWTIAKGLTLNLGVRLDKENLPSYNSLPGFQGISFGWGQKIAPRLGAAYDVLHNGKLKVYGSWGYFYDIMKFQLPQGSFGGAYWHDCVYALDDPNYNLILPKRDSQGHYCPVGTGATPANGSFPAMRFIENYDYREPSNDPNQSGSLGKTGLVDPNLKPMKQHVMTIGAAWELKHDMVFEPVYTRSRLDRTIEDAGTITQNGEVYYIVNPGFGVNATVPNCNGCPPNEKAKRDYDGLELRLTKRFSHDWFGAFSYTYSRLYGNYGGLTSTDVSDGVGRNGANTDRAFDEPFMAFDAHGKVADGLLATDRPHTLKANVYYNLKWWKFNTVVGLFQQVYSGTPLSSYESVWGAPVFVEGRGKWVDMTRDSATGNWIQGAVSEKRTPRFVQSDLSAYQDFKVSKTNERLVARVGAECVNCFNQHHATVITSNLLRTGQIKPALCGSAGTNCTAVATEQAGFDYGAVMSQGYNYTGLSNSANTILSSLYGTPQSWQRPRTVRFQVRFTF